MDEFSGGFSGDGIVGQDLILNSEGPFVICGVDVNRRGTDGVQFGEGADMVGMTVRQEVGGDGETVAFQNGFDIGSVVAGVDNERLFGFTPDNGAVHFEWADGENFDIHAAENKQGGRGIKAGMEKMSPDCS
jgi:hypothetical protein